MVAYEITSHAHQLIGPPKRCQPILISSCLLKAYSGLMLISSSLLLIAHYSGEVDLMNGTSDLLDLLDLLCGGGLLIRSCIIERE